ncbi:hypothetical protein GGF32_007964, partial [Allomyces javanicus]
MNDALPFWIHHDPRGGYDEDEANRRLENTRAYYRARWGDMPAAMWHEERAAPTTLGEPDASSAASSSVPAKQHGCVRDLDRPVLGKAPMHGFVKTLGKTYLIRPFLSDTIDRVKQLIHA